MKAATIRILDSKGRIVIPHEIREKERLLTGDGFEIQVTEDNGIYLRKYPAVHNSNKTD